MEKEAAAVAVGTRRQEASRGGSAGMAAHAAAEAAHSFFNTPPAIRTPGWAMAADITPTTAETARIARTTSASPRGRAANTAAATAVEAAGAAGTERPRRQPNPR